MPRDSDHQIDGELNGYNIGHHRCLAPECPQQSFASTGDQTLNFLESIDVYLEIFFIAVAVA